MDSRYPARRDGASSAAPSAPITFNIYVSGVGGEDAGRKAAEKVLEALVQATVVR